MRTAGTSWAMWLSDCTDDEAVAKNCFLFVRNRITHSGDTKAQMGTCTASEVHAKSHFATGG